MWMRVPVEPASWAAEWMPTLPLLPSTPEPTPLESDTEPPWPASRASPADRTSEPPDAPPEPACTRASPPVEAVPPAPADTETCVDEGTRDEGAE